MKVFISAGEASGDLYGAALIEELRRLDPEIEILGLGGSRMQEAGFQAIGDSSTWGSISILQSVREGLRAIGTFQRLKSAFAIGEPGVFVPIDFGFMNLRLCKAAKQAGWKVVYFIPPGSWRRDRQGADLPYLTDHIISNFPWSAEILNSMGASAHFFGHPLKQIHREILNSELPRSTVAVLPGSRRSELEQLLPILPKALEYEKRTACLPVPKHQVEYVRSRWPRSQDEVLSGSQKGAVIRTLKGSVSGLVCSGTATLEAALAKTPMVVVYKVSQAVVLETKLIGFKRPQFYSQPNILLQREVVPELIQESLNAENLKREYDRLFDDAVSSNQIAAYDEINEILGGDAAVTRSAELILSVLK
jgi:lipid-A-disaccharide synthase